MAARSFLSDVAVGGALTVDGVAVARLTVAATAPGSPAANDLWWDSTNGSLKIYYSDGSSSQWVVANPSGATGATGPRAVPRQHTYTYAASIEIDASLYDVIDITLAGPMTLTIANGTDGQTIRVRLKQDATGSRVLTLGAGIAASTDVIVPALSTGAGVTDRLAFEYSAARASYDLVSFARGY